MYPEVLACLSIEVLEIKKMVYLFLINYSRSRPDMVDHALPNLLSVSSQIASLTLGAPPSRALNHSPLGSGHQRP